MVYLEPSEDLVQEGKRLKKLARELEGLEEMGLAQLRERYHELFGEEPRSKNLPFLRKKLAFRIQERSVGGLSPHALALLVTIGPRELPQSSSRKPRRVQVVPAAVKAVVPKPRDPRLPSAGTSLVREFGGLAHEVEVQVNGFSYRGRSYQSLSAIAKEITGTAWNGFAFFRLMGATTDGQA